MSELLPQIDDPRSQLAARMFPHAWKEAVALRGTKGQRKRQKLRSDAENKILSDALRAKGAKCGNCNSYKKRVAIGAGEKEMFCEAHSDFYGDVLVKPESLCLSWKPTPPATLKGDEG